MLDCRNVATMQGTQLPCLQREKSVEFVISRLFQICSRGGQRCNVKTNTLDYFVHIFVRSNACTPSIVQLQSLGRLCNCVGKASKL